MMQSGKRIREYSKLGPDKAPFGITNPVKFGQNSADLSIGATIGYDPRMCYVGLYIDDYGNDIPALKCKDEFGRFSLNKPIELEYYTMGPEGLLLMPGAYCQAVTEQTVWCKSERKVSITPSDFNGVEDIKQFLHDYRDGIIPITDSRLNSFNGEYFTFDVSSKSSSARNALFTVMDSGIGDVGYYGPLTLELYAAGPNMIYPGSIVSQIRFFEVEGEQDELYEGYDKLTFDRAPQPKPIPVRKEFLEL